MPAERRFWTNQKASPKRFRQKNSARFNAKSYLATSQILETIESSVSNKLLNDEKAFWLFKTGRLFAAIQEHLFDDEKLLQDIAALRANVSEAPPNVSPHLLIMIEKVIKSGEEFPASKNLPHIESKLFTDSRNLLERISVLGS